MRQFGPENWTLYRGKHLLSFVDNHDVTRIADNLANPAHLPLIYALCFGMPGIPCIYYGSVWGANGRKSDGDPALRPCFKKPEENELTEFISRLSRARKSSRAITHGDLNVPVLTNRQCILKRECEGETVLIAINASEQPYTAGINIGGAGTDLLTGKDISINGSVEMPPYSAQYIRLK